MRVAVAGSPEEAYLKALASDPVSAFGMVCALNRPVSAALGQALSERFIDVLYAPGYDDEALESLKQKPDTRILDPDDAAAPRRTAREGNDKRAAVGGLAVEDARTGSRTEADGRLRARNCLRGSAATFVARGGSAKHVTSNSIVIAEDLATIGNPAPAR